MYVHRKQKNIVKSEFWDLPPDWGGNVLDLAVRLLGQSEGQLVVSALLLDLLSVFGVLLLQFSLEKRPRSTTG